MHIRRQNQKRNNRGSGIDKKYPAEELHVKNPAGGITSRSIQCNKRRAYIQKEDKDIRRRRRRPFNPRSHKSAPMGTYVLYGQPDEGAVLVEVNAKTKDLVEKIFAEMVQK